MSPLFHEWVSFSLYFRGYFFSFETILLGKTGKFMFLCIFNEFQSFIQLQLSVDHKQKTN